MEEAVLKFLQQNSDWNADPNAPEPHVSMDGPTLGISFWMHPRSFGWDERQKVRGLLQFHSFKRWCWDSTNDEGWYAGYGCFAGQAPRWGEFYEIVGGEQLGANSIPSPTRAADPVRHFLFYFRDEVIECYAVS